MLKLPTLLYRWYILHLFKVPINILIILLYNLFCAGLNLFLCSCLQLFRNSILDFWKIQCLWPYTLLQFIPIHLPCYLSPHLLVVGSVFLFKLPIYYHQNLNNTYDEPVADRRLREELEIDLVLPDRCPFVFPIWLDYLFIREMQKKNQYVYA